MLLAFNFRSVVRTSPSCSQDGHLREWGGGYRARDDRGERLKDELIAIAALIEAHPEEFASIIQANQGRRAWLEKKAAMERKGIARPDKPHSHL